MVHETIEIIINLVLQSEPLTVLKPFSSLVFRYNKSLERGQWQEMSLINDRQQE